MLPNFFRYVFIAASTLLCCHVSVLLPGADSTLVFHTHAVQFSECDSQQLGRKRHIGNDIVLFIFKEDKEPLDVSTFVSEMNHVFIVVHKCKEVHDTAATRYLVNFASKGGVHSFAPQLPYPPVFEKTNVFRR